MAPVPARRRPTTRSSKTTVGVAAGTGLFLSLCLVAALLHNRFVSWVAREISDYQDVSMCEFETDDLGLCEALHGVQCRKRIAVVGSGPISEEQRQEINTGFDAVIRFNALNNRLCGDALDIWVVHACANSSGPHSKPCPPHGYSGPGQLELCKTPSTLQKASQLWLLGGDQANRSALVEAFPAAKKLDPVLINPGHWAKPYRELVGDGEPSTGWIGLMLALACAPVGGDVHLFGFNWAKGLSWKHNVYGEGAFVDTLDEAGKITLHMPPCDNLRECEGCAILTYATTSLSVCKEDEHPQGGDVRRARRDEIETLNREKAESEIGKLEDMGLLGSTGSGKKRRRRIRREGAGGSGKERTGEARRR